MRFIFFKFTNSYIQGWSRSSVAIKSGASIDRLCCFFTMFIMKNHSIYATLAGCIFTWVVTFNCQAQGFQKFVSEPENLTIPDQFRSLYEELDKSLDKYGLIYKLREGGTCSAIAPNLFMAMSAFGPAAPGSERWNDLLLTLDAFREMKMKAVTVMIIAPDLTIGDTKSLVAFYRRLADEIHSRGLMLYIEHFNSSPSRKLSASWSDGPPSKKTFLDMMYNELYTIYSQIRPDYLSLLTEPEITMIKWTHLAFSASELSEWIGNTASRLKNLQLIPGTLLGAGAGTWESEDFDTAFARQKDLDYIDIHLYPLSLNGEDQIGRLAKIIGDLRKARPDIKVILGETWLYKHGAEEPEGVMDKNAYYRDNFGFWSPLDIKFMHLVMAVARKENIALVCPYFSQFFFVYYNFSDSGSANLPPFPACVPAAWHKAAGALKKNMLSPTGTAINEMLSHDCPIR